MDKSAVTPEATPEASPETPPARRLAFPLNLLGSATLDSFAIRDYRWMWISSLLSMAAMNMQMITRVWLVLRLRDDSPLAVVYIVMTFALPVMFVSLLGGVLADRFPKRKMMIIAQSGNVLLTLMVAVLDVTDLISFWHLIVIGLGNGSLMAISMPSRQTIISEILPEDKLMNGIALQTSAASITSIAGPALAGILIIFIETAGVFFLVAGIYVLSVVALSMINAGGEVRSRSGEGMRGDIRAGFAYTMGRPTLLALMVMAFIPVMFGMSYWILLGPWAREALNVASDDLGILMMTMGIGALAGSLFLASLRNFKNRGALLLAMCVAWGIALAVFGQSSSYTVAVPLLLFVGLASSIYRALSMTMLQIYADPEMRGRVMSIAMMTYGLMPLSAVPFGIFAERYGTAHALTLSGILLTVSTLLFATAYPRFRRIQ